VSILDRSEHWEAVDARSMRHLIQSFPGQVAGAAQMAQTLSLRSGKHIANIVVSGMGGSAIGGDVVKAALGSVLRVPMVVCRDYRLPGFVDAATVLFASSYSGNTEETLTAYDSARSAGAAILCLTSGGKLAARARDHGYPVIQLPAGLPPRAALGYSAIMLLGALTALGQVPDMSADLRETEELLTKLVVQYCPETPERKNRPKQLARSLHGKIIALYASSGILDPVAVRWRGQIEENAKNLAFHHLLPEMNHNEIVGWRLPDPVLRQIGVVLLRDRDEPASLRCRFDFTREVVAAKAGACHEVWTEGESALARLFSLICLGDFVSLYLALLNRVDPTPVEIIETLKEKCKSAITPQQDR
jgi:glucose/mannose-6-phosphate isomerase